MEAKQKKSFINIVFEMKQEKSNNIA